jgi:hypothetical protein
LNWFVATIRRLLGVIEESLAEPGISLFVMDMLGL